jgi:SPP1 gp7 family putative phage head morphogenesis protein
VTNAARTAAFASAFGLASRPRRVPQAQPPTIIEADYAAELVAFAQEWRAAAEQLIADLPRLYRTDDVRTTRRRTARVRGAVESTVARVPVIAERSARRVVEHSKRQVARQTKAALGIEIPAPINAEPRVRAFIAENVALVQKLGNATADTMEATLARAFAEGWSDTEVAEELTKRFGMAERHARFIARDQITRLYSQVTRMQHHDLGVAVFRWMTRRDRHVRHSHKVKHGRLFPYKGSRAPSFFPGDEIGCRCWEEPVFEEIKANARALAGKGRARR